MATMLNEKAGMRHYVIAIVETLHVHTCVCSKERERERERGNERGRDGVRKVWENTDRKYF